MIEKKIILVLSLYFLIATVDLSQSRTPSIEEISQHVIEKLQKQGTQKVTTDENRIREIIQQVLDEKLINNDNAINDNAIITTSVKGEKGIQGKSMQGERGRIGLPGLMGLKGVQGKTGSVGPPGAPGENGRPGLNGLQGVAGIKGQTGKPGIHGVNGSPGSNGINGKHGDTGPIGPKGDEGDQGENGANGKDGLIGPKGDEGVEGIKGEQGERGEMGLRGNIGHAGPIGPAGEKGESITGPQGPRGKMGPPGPASMVPIHAKPMKVVKSETGPQGPVGPRGEKGEKGDFGPEGLTGPQGPPGKTGPRGRVGKGIPGKSGLPGNDGQMGYTGDQGPRGTPGLKGDKGEKGETAKPSLSSQKAYVLFTTTDLNLMVDMFPTGTLVFISSTDELFIRSVTGWLEIAVKKTNLQSSKKIASLGGPNIQDYQDYDNRIPTPGMMDRRLMDGHLVIPEAGIIVPRPYLLLMALNDPLSGLMGGVGGADYRCFKQANELGLDGGTFRAFLSDRYQGIKYLVSDKFANHAIANFQGERLFDSYLSIFNTSGYAAFNPKIPIYSFSMKDVRLDEHWPIKKIWHGSHAHGELHKTGHPCKNWRTNLRTRKATAASIISFTPALNEEFTRCDQQLITLCIQTTLR